MELFEKRRYSKKELIEILSKLDKFGISYHPVNPYMMTVKDIDFYFSNDNEAGHKILPKEELKKILPDNFKSLNHGYPHISYMYIHLPGSDIGNGKIAIFNDKYEFIGYRYLEGLKRV